jgi:hypothetical protein
MPRRDSSSTTVRNASENIPWHVAERCERDRFVALAGRPLVDWQDQFRSKSTAAVVRMNVDLLEMYRVALDHLDVRNTYRNVVG